ncbi:MAG: hypothetical protein BWY09_02019 [Candidatus Hydrogenedentes bacterium ADurb.Bin179]|nr:MAG: hypothetical protein BWY09_02019 [Candidatus Hydrogenedentes bacterium ADurb.Bin179]
MPDILLLVKGVHAQFGGAKPLFITLFQFLDALFRRFQFPRGRIQFHGTRAAAEQFPHRLARVLALDVPEGRFNPRVMPAEIAHLPNTLLDQGNIRGVIADKVRPQNVAQSSAFPAHRGARAVSRHAVIGNHLDEGEPVFRLGQARNPAGIKRRRQRNGHMIQFNARNSTHSRISSQKRVYCRPRFYRERPFLYIP